jgi:cell division protein ZapA
MSRVDVQIMGQGYVLASPDGEEDALRQAAQRVNDAMCSIRDAGKIKARDRIAVLASLNLAFDLNKQAHSASPTPPQPGVAADANGAGNADEAAQDQILQSLISKLDQALQSDGRLL